MGYVETIPLAIQDAYLLVQNSGVCADVGELKASGPSSFNFTCTFNLPNPNPAGLPGVVSLKAIVTDAFPYRPVDFYPSDNEVLAGFPHQGSSTGKLCLPPEQEAPCDAQRLLVYVNWARSWLLDAANNSLLKPGEPFELPDFCRKKLIHSAATDLTVFFDESADTFGAWQDRIGQTGIVEFNRSSIPRGLLVNKFFTAGEQLIQSAAFPVAVSKKTLLRSRWLLMPEVIVERHRAAQNYGELQGLCSASNINFKKVLKRAWVEGSNAYPYNVLLVGFPIPKNVGGKAVEIHWQPLLIPNKYATKRVVPRRKGKLDEGRLWGYEWNQGRFAKEKPLYWGKTENLSRSRLFARGSFSTTVRSKSMALVGCGALGATIAEGLCRGGIGSMSFFDAQVVEFGNLCRHSLDGRDVERAKATALADRLRSTSMTTRITAHSLHVPWSRNEDGAHNAIIALENANVLLDCSTDHAAFLWLSAYARKNRKPLASLFINPHSTILTLVLSGKQTSARKVYQSLMTSIEQDLTPVDSSTYFAELSDEDAILPGAGCWHATFPALNTHIQSLALAAIGLIVAWLEDQEHCDGFGILIRRNSNVGVGPITEVIWRQPYR